MKQTNLLFILSDQHSRDCLGCYGHSMVQTPHLDRLAERGTLFRNAYTNCPICVPERASLATGRYVHEIGFWDNGIPYDGSVKSWGHRLKESGYRVDSIGKLHFRSGDDDNGFTEEHDPLHVVEGIGDLLGCIRENAPFRKKRDGILEAGPGDSTYLQYDERNAATAWRWLREHAEDEKQWALFLSFACPHPPYIAPERWFRKYPLDKVPMPNQWKHEDWPHHPAIDYFREFFNFAEPYSEEEIRQLVATYLGVCSYLDEQIGSVLGVLSQLGLDERTRIIYTTDHGESLGARGMFGKFVMYEESASVPLIIAGPGVPQGRKVGTPVSLVDCYPTVLESIGVELMEEEGNLPGHSLWQTADEPDRDRVVFSEYHAVGSRHASYMLRDSRFKYVHYVNDRPQLFDLGSDPKELVDESKNPRCREVVERFEKRLRQILDPEETDSRAKADQREKVDSFGGEAAVRSRGAFDNSPAPGEAPKFKPG